VLVPIVAAAALVVLCARRRDTYAPPSCAGRRPGADRSCGPSRDRDCCERLELPGGTYRRTHDAVACPAPGPTASVSPFVLDTYEVTVGRFRAFLDAGRGIRDGAPAEGAGVHPRVAGSGWQSSWNGLLEPDRATLEKKLECGAASVNATSPDREWMPINCVTWYEAFAFCAWDEGRLPTEAEWNFAASGGDEQRVFPWSQPPSSTLVDARHAVYARPFVERVGMHAEGDGRFGQSDLSGNVWEWMIDAADPAQLLPAVGKGPCELAGYPTECRDCANLEPLAGRVLRGGGFGIPQEGLYSSLRRASSPLDRFHVFGIRCARDAHGATSIAPRSAVSSGVACAECDAGAFPSFARGSALGALPLRVHPAGAARADELSDGTIAKLREGDAGTRARFALVDFGMAWAPRLHDVTERLRELARLGDACGGRVMTILLEGSRPGQAADAYDLIQWVAGEHVEHAAAFDPTGRLRAAPGMRARSILVDLDELRVLEDDDGDLDSRSAVVTAFRARCAAHQGG